MKRGLPTTLRTSWHPVNETVPGSAPGADFD